MGDLDGSRRGGDEECSLEFVETLDEAALGERNCQSGSGNNVSRLTSSTFRKILSLYGFLRSTRGIAESCSVVPESDAFSWLPGEFERGAFDLGSGRAVDAEREM